MLIIIYVQLGNLHNWCHIIFKCWCSLMKISYQTNSCLVKFLPMLPPTNILLRLALPTPKCILWKLSEQEWGEEHLYAMYLPLFPPEASWSLGAIQAFIYKKMLNTIEKISAAVASCRNLSWITATG